MPGPIRKFKSDPNNRGRGKGSYYHRGRGYYSKYSGRRDKKIDSVGSDPIGEGRYRQTDDRSGRKARARGRQHPKPPRRPKKGASPPKSSGRKKERPRRKDGRYKKRPGPKSRK